jgi:hypothetical protein
MPEIGHLIAVSPEGREKRAGTAESPGRHVAARGSLPRRTGFASGPGPGGQPGGMFSVTGLEGPTPAVVVIVKVTLVAP